MPQEEQLRPFQGFSIDFAFAGQRSKDENMAVDFVGCGGETCCASLVDHFTEKLCGAARISKVPPVAVASKIPPSACPRR